MSGSALTGTCMPPGSNSPDLVDRRLRQLALLGLREALDRVRTTDICERGKALRALPAVEIISLLRIPDVVLRTLAIASYKRRGEAISDRVILSTIASLEQAIEKRPPSRPISGFDDAAVLVESDLLEFLGRQCRSPFVTDGARVADSAARGCDCLEALFPDGGSAVRELVRIVAGIDGARNSLESFSSEDVPGFVAFCVNGSDAFLAEQLLHEATHIHFDLLLAERADVRSWLRSLPALHSPFTDSARPAMRVAHGILSYSVVFELWKRIANAPPMAAMRALAVNDRISAGRLVQERLQIVGDRVLRGRRQFEQILDQDELIRWAEMVEMIVPYGLPSWSRDLPARFCDVSAVAERLRESRSLLNLTERAEVILSLADGKLSRVKVKPSDSRALMAALGEDGVACFSHRLHVTMNDPLIGGFSNITERNVDWDGHGAEDADAFAYLGPEPRLMRAVADADLRGEAGSFYRIPSCCQEFFAREWDRACRDSRGNLAEAALGEMIFGKCRVWSFAWQSNLFAMFFGGSLVVHFPCRLGCESTIREIDRRRRILESVDADLCRAIVRSQALPILWTETLGVGRFPTADLSRLSFFELSWLGVQDVPRRLEYVGLRPIDLRTPSRWADATEALGCRWLLVEWTPSVKETVSAPPVSRSVPRGSP